MTLNELSPGMAVRWIHEPCGGYGFPTLVAVVDVKVCARRVCIEVPLRDGGWVERSVRPESLRPRYV